MAVGRRHDIDEREAEVLNAARLILLREGYSALTMDRLAEEAACPKGTLYRRFTCKEDVLLGLAAEALGLRNALVLRGSTYDGRSRDRMVAVGEGHMIFCSMLPEASRIVHLATGAIRDSASDERNAALEQAEQTVTDCMQAVLTDALASGELRLPPGSNLGEATLAFCALMDGGMNLIETGFAQRVPLLEDPLFRMWRALNLLADSYGWRPLSTERPWEEILAEVRRAVFPEESAQLYGAATAVRPRETEEAYAEPWH